MFKRGAVVQHADEKWIGVVTLDGKDGLIVKWFEGRTGGGLVDRTLVTPIDGHAFEAALALGDTATALRLYREVQEGEDAAQGALDAVMQQLGEKTRQLQQTEANERRLQAAFNVIGMHLRNSTDEQVLELTGEKPYFMPGIITAVQFLVDAHTKLQAALEPFAAYGQLKRLYPDEAVFTIAYDREGNAVKILFSDFTRAAAAHPDARANTHATPTSGGAGGIAEIMEVKA